MLDFTGQGWEQVGALLVALLLCSLIGLERQLRQKAAGLRTHTLVGVGAALFMLVSKWGFTDVLLLDDVNLDPSRVASQIVSGIGFIGAGLIFVRRDTVRGLTTAATVWVVAAVGTAAGAGLWLLAAAVTGAHFLVAYAYPALTRRITRSAPYSTLFEVEYLDGRGALRSILSEATRRDYTVRDVRTSRGGAGPAGPASIDLSLLVVGRGEPSRLAAALAEVDGVLSVHTADPDDVEG
ncbi:MgtC/SapB family protein [Nocardiopsis composta]|uniref:Putative Mg2+ transporter-C (MgtC) family protein n=1 Tax=Nocardiopsis composta TaxID=157465 RepID=A0A7W8QGG5_9ACTN|nr:MgtC/SapB family protein [Nocardiopsis composta]MBB5430007.1 putative Mg2+ transporter-C (MgtC) family protein [Nocardiopsis composta]